MHVLSAIHQHRRILSKEKPFLYLFLTRSRSTPLEYLAETNTRMATFQVKPFVFEALFESFLSFFFNFLY